VDADGTTSTYSGIVSFENGVATLGDEGSATYTFTVSSAGTYDIAIRLCYPFWDKNGIYVSIDGSTSEAFHGKQALVAILEKHLLDDACQQYFTISRYAYHQDIRGCQRRAVLWLPGMQQLFGSTLRRHGDIYLVSATLYRCGRQSVSAGQSFQTNLRNAEKKA
jgi:hypothetical protein